MTIINNDDYFTFKIGIKYILSSFIQSLYILALIGFLSPLLLHIKLNEWMPESIEWPVGTTNNVVLLKNNRYVIGHVPTNRIQFYNMDLEFERGFYINAASKGFRLTHDYADGFFIYQYSGSLKYHFDYNGTLLKTEKYDISNYSNLDTQSFEITIPHSIILEPLTSPIKAWLLMGLLIVSGILVARPWKEKTNKNLKRDC